MLTKVVRHFIVFSLLTILFGKVLFSTSPNALLYVYGALVSLVIFITFLVAFFIYEDPYIAVRGAKESKLVPDKLPLVSCMVAAMNEESLISRCIDSLINQTYQNKEIIVVNDASTDGTPGILQKYAELGTIKLIDLKTNVGKKRALGKAMLVANGEIFAFTDSDSVWAEDVVKKMVAIFNSDPLIGAVSGHTRAWNGDQNLLTRVQDSWYEGQFSIRKAFESVFGAVTCVSGPLAVFRKEAIFNLIPAWENDAFLGQEFKFATDRTLTGFILGNRFVGKKLKEKYPDSPFVTKIDYPLREWKVVYSKATRAWTIVPNTFKRVIRQQIRWKKSFIRNTCFTGSFYWKKPFLPALFYYLHILFVLIGPFIAFRHLVYLPAQGYLYSVFLYLTGIIFVGLMFGLAYKLENKESHVWVYRPLMSLFSTLVLSWLLFYSALTIKKMVWSRI